MTPHRPLPKTPDFPALEQQVLERWRERDIFRESVRRRQGAEEFVFYEGPPTANGRPGSHHVLARVFKDIFPRYQTMLGKYVERKGGWDCHGLPVEIAVEQKLGFKTKHDIERYGIAEFNQQCRESVFEFLEDWNALTERIGYWVDLEHPYRTLDTTYIESVWWALKTMWERDLLFEGHRVVPYCVRCGTALSSHEVAQGYEDVEDPSIYVTFPVTEPVGPLRAGDRLLAWTTTPWTVLSHAALAVAPDLTYVRTEDGYVLAEARVEAVLGEDAADRRALPGREILGTRYEPPFDFIKTEEYGPKGHTVLPGDFVSADDGTGIVHTSIAFGEDDYRLGQEQGINVINPVRLDGTYDERMGPYAGRWVKEADPDIVEDLRERGRLLRAETYLHAYPHCWRCGTPLLYYAKPSWFVGTSKLRDRLLAANETVDWHPEHIKHGRMGRWLENNVDWAISRERYWGTPLPVWRCENGHAECIGSLAELAEKSGDALEDPHRPYVDAPTWDCAECGEPMRRVPEVIDVWFDSGCMPFAQHHAPFENEDVFEQRFPANYICEAIDQTRGWFYSLLAVSTLLFDQAPYKTVLVLGHIADPEGKKMSKSLGNIVPPWEVIDQPRRRRVPLVLPDLQAAVGRLPVLDRDGRRVGAPVPAPAVEHVRLLRPVRERQRRHGAQRAGDRPRPLGALAPAGDRGGRCASASTTTTPRAPATRSRRSSTSSPTGTCAARGGASGTATRPRSGRCTPASSRSRSCSPRSRRSSPTSSTTTSTAPSRACTWRTFRSPASATRRSSSTWPWRARRSASGCRARSQSKLKVRQPLRAAVVVAADRERAALDRLGDVVREELNVKEIRYVAQADELGSYEIKPNYRALGPRFGKLMPQVAAAVAALDPAHVAAALRDGRHVGVSVDGHDHDLGPDDLPLVMKPLEGYQLEREGSHAVALELELDDELRREGLAREVVHAVQNARKSAGLEVEDRIELRLGGDDELLAAAREYEGYVSGRDAGDVGRLRRW